MNTIEDSLKARAVDDAAMLEFFKKYGFRSWLQEALKKSTGKHADGKDDGEVDSSVAGSHQGSAAHSGLFDVAQEPVTSQYETVLTQAQLDDWPPYQPRNTRTSRLTALSWDQARSFQCQMTLALHYEYAAASHPAELG